MAALIDGKKIAAEVRGEITKETEAFVAEHGYAPGLTVIIVGENPASQVYVETPGSDLHPSLPNPLASSSRCKD